MVLQMIFMSWSLEPVNVIIYGKTGSLSTWLNQGSWDGEIILDCPGGPKMWSQLSLREGGRVIASVHIYTHKHVRAHTHTQMGGWNKEIWSCWPWRQEWCSHNPRNDDSYYVNEPSPDRPLPHVLCLTFVCRKAGVSQAPLIHKSLA